MYLLLLIGLVEVPADGVVGDVEGMVPRRHLRVGASLHHERVLAAAHHVDLRDQQPVDVPRDAPAHVACTQTVTQNDSCYKNISTCSFAIYIQFKDTKHEKTTINQR